MYFLSFEYDICNYIDEYVTEHLFLKFKIDFPENYPTLRIKWDFLDIDTSIRHDPNEYGGMTLDEYFKYIVQNYMNLIFKNIF